MLLLEELGQEAGMYSGLKSSAIRDLVTSHRVGVVSMGRLASGGRDGRWVLLIIYKCIILDQLAL
jgi:hypothetical protein